MEIEGRATEADPISSAGADSLDLTACDREPIHVPGAIQPHGLLLIADLALLGVIGGAGDIEGRLSPDWLGRNLELLMGQDLAAAVARAEGGAAVSLGTIAGQREGFDAVLHVSGEHVLVELEPRADRPQSAAAVLTRLDTLGTSFGQAADLIQLSRRAAQAFRQLTGFDRVMIYRFLDDSAGVVLAEDRDPALPTFLNHHFPAGDIPKQARALYVRNRVRVIPEVDYTPAPIRGQTGLAATDLSDVALRSVSPIHIQYLKNMGVGASASISIVKDGLLWGLVACHHNSARAISHETQLACSTLAGTLARQIRAREEAETYRERIRLRSAEEEVLARLEPDAEFDRFFAGVADELRRVVDADGFVAIQGGGVIASGHRPSAAELTALARWVTPRAAAEPFVTHELASRFQPAAEYQDVASGLAAVTLATDVPTVLMWFRAEMPETVEWAGNPHKEAAGAGELTPRHSFAAWREVVNGKSRRWTRGETEALSRLRRALMEARQGHRLRELNRRLGELVVAKDALLVEKDHLLKEVNHRVQNSLQLVQAFLALQAREEESPVVQAHLGEAQRRVTAVALVHRRLYQADQVETIDLARYMEELVGEMRASMGEEWRAAISLDLAPVLISADRAVTIGLILTELVINANKYAYGGGAGPVSIALEQYRLQFRLIVADHGVGEARERKGFGTRMISAMVQRLGGAIERYDNAPGLRVIVAAPIDAE